MKKNPNQKVAGRVLPRLIILLGICFLACGGLAPIVGDFLPVDGCTNAEGDQVHVKIVLAGESSDVLQTALICLGLVLLLAGIIMKRRGQ